MEDAQGRNEIDVFTDGCIISTHSKLGSSARFMK